MLRKIFSACLVLTSSFVFAQTSAVSVKLNNSSESAPSGVDSADYFLQKGLQEKEKGRRLESLKNFELAAKYNGKSKTITSELASAYYDLRKYHQATEMYKKLVELGETSPANYKTLLNLSFQLKQNEDVLFYADKLKASDPAEKVLYFVGKVHYNMDDYGNAIKYLNGAAKEDPSNAEIPYLIARSYADMLNYKQAVPYFKQAIALKPDGTWLYELGLICYAMHADKEALQYMLEAGEKGYRRDNDYLENLGIAYLNVGNLDQGVLILNEILKKRPSDMNILHMVAEAYYYKGKYDLAIEYWDRVLQADKTEAPALYMIGMAYQKKGGEENKQKGVALCDKAIEMDPQLASLKQKKQMPGL